jgi:O-antigen/teichoic acid export membrane protein
VAGATPAPTSCRPGALAPRDLWGGVKGRAVAVRVDPAADEALDALRNAAKLGASLIATWTVALAVRMLLPRALGPEAFGAVSFAEAVAATAFVLVGVGADTYIRQQIPTRPAHASEFVGGVLLLRLALGVAVLGGVALLLHSLASPPEVRRVVYLCCGGQLAASMNGSLAALLHARGTVDGLSFANVAGKVLWAGGVLAGLASGHGLTAVGAAYLASELAKLAALLRLARRHLGLSLRADPAVTRAVLVASLPFYANAVATSAATRIDVPILAALVGDAREVGWYGAAWNLSSLALLVAPVIGWVIVPLLARARARSDEDLSRALARAVEAVLLLGIPASLFLALGADVWIAVMYGDAFAPAAPALRILAPVFVFTYVASVSGACLNVLGRGWTTTLVSVVGLVVNPALNVWLVPAGARWLAGGGGAGAGAAVATMVSEGVVAALLTGLLGARAFDRRTIDLCARTLLVCAAVVAIHGALAPLGAARLAADAAAYVLLAAQLRAVRWQELADLARSAWRRPRVIAP